MQIFSFTDVLVKCITSEAFNFSSNNQTVKKRPSIFIAIHQQQVTTSLTCLNATWLLTKSTYVRQGISMLNRLSLNHSDLNAKIKVTIILWQTVIIANMWGAELLKRKHDNRWQEERPENELRECISFQKKKIQANGHKIMSLKNRNCIARRCFNFTRYNSHSHRPQKKKKRLIYRRRMSLGINEHTATEYTCSKHQITKPYTSIDANK